MQCCTTSGLLARKSSPNQRVFWKSISEASPFSTAWLARSPQFFGASGPYHDVVSIRPSATVRAGCRAANASATMPPIEAPAISVLSQPRCVSMSAISSANCSTV